MERKYKDPHLHYVAATAIIRKNGRYLITKRSPNEKAFPNRWTVPGGRISVDEYLEIPKTTPDAWYGALIESLKREIKEEVNLEIKNVQFLTDMTFIRPDGIPVVVISFYSDYKCGKIILDEDSVDYTWVTAKEAKGYDLIEGIYEEILMVEKIIKGADPRKVKFIPKKY